MTLAEAARWYADQGWPVFPIAPGRKVPAIARREGGRGYLDATRDPDQLAAWWARWPDANLGLPTGQASGVIVVDVDARHGGFDTLARLEARSGGLVTLEAATPGGAHLYFTAPTIKVHNSTGDRERGLGPGLDVRGDGGYVVLPPSRRPDGAYAWCSAQRGATPLPAWVLDILAPPPPPRPPRRPAWDRGAMGRREYATLAYRLHEVRSAPPGQRNATLNRAAYTLGWSVGGGALPYALVCDELLAAAMTAGLGEREARATISSGMTAALRRTGTPP